MNEADYIAEIHRREAARAEFVILVAGIVLSGAVLMVVLLVQWLAE